VPPVPQIQISLIVAIAENGVIGKGGELPWHIPADLKHFKALTMGKPMIMGRKTYDSIGKPLPGRTSIVITRHPDYGPDGVITVHTWTEAIEVAMGALKDTPEDEVMVIGGAEIYGLALADAGRLYLTEIHDSIEGDTMFPDIDRTQWHEASRQEFLTETPAFSFVTLERNT
jgi:dihydrofolate reductase